MTKFQLMSALMAKGCVGTDVTDTAGVVYNGIVQSVQREDGSGHSFNVTMNVRGHKIIVHVRTID